MNATTLFVLCIKVWNGIQGDKTWFCSADGYQKGCICDASSYVKCLPEELKEDQEDCPRYLKDMEIVPEYFPLRHDFGNVPIRISHQPIKQEQGAKKIQVSKEEEKDDKAMPKLNLEDYKVTKKTSLKEAGPTTRKVEETSRDDDLLSRISHHPIQQEQESRGAKFEKEDEVVEGATKPVHDKNKGSKKTSIKELGAALGRREETSREGDETARASKQISEKKYQERPWDSEEEEELMPSNRECVSYAKYGTYKENEEECQGRLRSCHTFKDRQTSLFEGANGALLLSDLNLRGCSNTTEYLEFFLDNERTNHKRRLTQLEEKQTEYYNLYIQHRTKLQECHGNQTIEVTQECMDRLARQTEEHAEAKQELNNQVRELQTKLENSSFTCKNERSKDLRQYQKQTQELEFNNTLALSICQQNITERETDKITQLGQLRLEHNEKMRNVNRSWDLRLSEMQRNFSDQIVKAAEEAQQKLTNLDNWTKNTEWGEVKGQLDEKDKRIGGLEEDLAECQGYFESGDERQSFELCSNLWSLTPKCLKMAQELPGKLVEELNTKVTELKKWVYVGFGLSAGMAILLGFMGMGVCVWKLGCKDLMKKKKKQNEELIELE